MAESGPHRLRADTAALAAQQQDSVEWGHMAALLEQGLFDGLTFGAFENDGPFTVEHQFHDGQIALDATQAKLLSQYTAAVYYRNACLIVCVGALCLGSYFKRGNAGFFSSKSSLNH